MQQFVQNNIFNAGNRSFAEIIIEIHSSMFSAAAAPQGLHFLYPQIQHSDTVFLNNREKIFIC